MRSILFSFGTTVIPSYSLFLLLGVLAGLITLGLRTRIRPIDQVRLTSTMLVGLVGGWVGSRVIPATLAQGIGGLRWEILSPTTPASPSYTAFMAVSIPLTLLMLWPERSRMLLYLDAITPSPIIGLAFAKVGCLLAGCCFGAICPPQWGIEYPYGSPVYEWQWRYDGLEVPEDLIAADEQGKPALLLPANVLSAVRNAPSEKVQSQLESLNLSLDEAVARTNQEHSYSVWPVPLWYTGGAIFLWAVAELVFRRARRTGWTTATVIGGYAVMRLVFDTFLAPVNDAVAIGLSLPQLMSLVPLTAAIAIIVLALKGKTPPMEAPVIREAGQTPPPS